MSKETTSVVLEKKTTRAFGGKTSGFINNQERNFEKAHLKAYLAGKKTFRQGPFVETINGRQRQLHKVIELRVPVEE